LRGRLHPSPGANDSGESEGEGDSEEGEEEAGTRLASAHPIHAAGSHTEQSRGVDGGPGDGRRETREPAEPLPKPFESSESAGRGGVLIN